MGYKAIARKAIESLYEGLCAVITQEEQRNPITKRTEFVEVEHITDQPCRLSFKPIRSADQDDTVSSISQTTTLFLSPDVVIPPGSKIIVTQHGITQEYKQSGVPAHHSAHQEIALELFEEWA